MADKRTKVLIIGAAGRDFHNFNMKFREAKDVEVVGFTAAQIPKIDGRMYPVELAGPLYPNGIPIWAEKDLELKIKEHKVDMCYFSYSDVTYNTVMSLASRVLSAGSDFGLISHRDTMVESKKPCAAITAIRTGCGKSQTSRYFVETLRKAGKKVAVCRHPMPYGDLAKQICQRFETYEDLKKHDVTIEEREEYEQHIDNGTVVFAGVDYEKIMRAAEAESDVVLWDGGNNDLPFFKPSLWMVVCDPHRAGHEMAYYPGDVNFRCADVICINKVNTAPEGGIQKIRDNAAKLNPNAKIITTISEVTVDLPELIKGKRVMCIDDGPTLTHGEMQYGAGKVAADKYEAGEIVDPRPQLVGTLKETFDKYPHLGKLVPAMGYFPQQIIDLEQSVNVVDCDSVIIATPMDLRKLIKIEKPSTQAKYSVLDHEAPFLKDILKEHFQL